MEVDDPTSPLSHINKGKNIIFGVNDKEVQMHFQRVQARIHDAHYSFFDAPAAYYPISQESLLRMKTIVWCSRELP